MTTDASWAPGAATAVVVGAGWVVGVVEVLGAVVVATVEVLGTVVVATAEVLEVCLAVLLPLPLPPQPAVARPTTSATAAAPDHLLSPAPMPTR
jgi:hypothetical protein